MLKLFNLLKTKLNLLKLKDSYQNQIQHLNYKPIETDNKIQIGHKLTQVIEKNRHKSILNFSKKAQFKPDPIVNRLLITCSTKSKNHYAGQLYNNFSDHHNLASASWHNRISSGKYFTINPNGAHPSLLSSKKNDLLEFNLNESLIKQLETNLNITKPCNIQCSTLNEFKNRQSHLLINAETGGGKTLGKLKQIN